MMDVRWESVRLQYSRVVLAIKAVEWQLNCDFKGSLPIDIGVK
jgi:hypothetical protein